MRITEDIRLPRSVEHGVRPLTVAVLILGVAVLAGGVGFGFGATRHYAPTEITQSDDSMLETIVKAGPKWMTKNALCQATKDHSGVLVFSWLPPRLACEYLTFRQLESDVAYEDAFAKTHPK